MEWTNEDGFDWCEMVDVDTWLGRALQPDVRPGKWSWENIQKVLGIQGADNRRNEDQRRGCTLVNTDIVGTSGVLPSVSITFAVILPGERLDFHRHNYFALYYWVKGEGYTVIDDDSIDREEHRLYWKTGDVVTAPAWCNHAHVSLSDEPVVQLAVHDVPEMAFKRTFLSEDPVGHEHLRHMVRGVVPAFDDLTTRDQLENSPHMVIKEGEGPQVVVT